MLMLNGGFNPCFYPLMFNFYFFTVIKAQFH